MPAAQATTDQPAPIGPAGVPEQARVWAEGDLADLHAKDDKAQRVEKMFAAIAGAYDLNNRLHSLGLDQLWRRAAVRAAALEEGQVAADIACGTGDLTEMLAKTPARRVIGLDFTNAMLAYAREKRATRPGALAGKIEYLWADAHRLPLRDSSIDALTIAYGIRNVQRPGEALKEFARVLKPGGRLVILEFDRPANPVVRMGHEFYTHRVMPLTATLISGDRSGAYRYLPKSVETFLTRDTLVGLIEEAGLATVTVRSLTFGVCACYRGVKPA
ncbi:MAG: bifunctional demethylmenaquinone methyltransferase/2-methoxy-6-polyprenyl-1,4-benzoquinol methylase UbiE [Planctomycetota bacterium]